MQKNKKNNHTASALNKNQYSQKDGKISFSNFNFFSTTIISKVKILKKYILLFLRIELKIYV